MVSRIGTKLFAFGGLRGYVYLMGHNLHAILGNAALAAALSRHLMTAKVQLLSQDFAFIPVTLALLEEVNAMRVPGPREVTQNLTRLADGLPALLSRVSRDGWPAAYIETDYHEGRGTQGAALFADGELQWAVGHTDSGAPIEEALKRIGVTAAPGKSAFTTLELEQYDDTEEWEDATRSVSGRALTT